MTLTAAFEPQTVNVEISGDGLSVGTGVPVVREFVDRDPYEGSYDVTPSAETHVLSTKHLRMTDDVTIHPIPSNYGLITWNGSFLIVS